MIALALLAAQPFTCTPVAIWDADGPIWCEEGPRIRVAGIAALEADGKCLPSHPCATMQPERARSMVARVIRATVTGKLRTGHLAITAPAMRCTGYEMSGKRVVASCRLSDGRDLGCAIVASGAAVRWDRYWRKYGLRGCD